MKDAFGGAFIIRIMLVFFVIFISFMAVAINWAKAFRIKSNVISILEKTDSDGAVSRIEAYLKSISYQPSQKILDDITEDCNKRSGKDNKEKDISLISGQISGVCIIPVGDSSEHYYQVISYFYLSSPLFGINTLIPISGESKTISDVFQ